MTQLRDAVVRLDPEIITPDVCSTLLPFCLTPEELRACQAYTGPADKLDIVRLYYIHCGFTVIGKSVCISG